MKSPQAVSDCIKNHFVTCALVALTPGRKPVVGVFSNNCSYIWSMFRFLTSTILCLLAYVGSAQKISGTVVEAETKEPIPFAGVFLMKSDSSFFRSTNTDKQGAFHFDSIHAGNYFIEINYLGFKKAFSESFAIKNGDEKNVGIIPLTVGEFSLEEFEVKASKLTYENAADRKIYNVGEDIQAQSGSVSDILQNIPSVTVEAEGEILLRGSGNVTFLLNGKTSGLLKSNPASFLEQIPAHTIERIEVITNPSAKFRPDGTAGIINIVTKKNVIPGFNGNILLNASTNRRYNGNLTLNYNPGKFNIAFSTGYWKNYSPRSFTDYRIRRDTFLESETIFDLQSNSIAIFNAPRASLTLDFIPDEKNSLSGSISYNKFLADRGNASTTIEKNAMTVLNDYTTNREQDDTESEFEMSFSGEHAFENEDHIISIEASLYEDDESENSIHTDVFRNHSIREDITGNK
ncbi:MAG TPA: carboxypeptidase regulatory-like domain-containing protein, partial [Saprospiraceae bacterium]|nr:carboxypeptidase regulatory-like domain-containing protein [Saprospiraceae bacterium]